MTMSLVPNSILIKSKKYGDFLYCWLKSAYGKEVIKKLVSGAGQPKFNKTQFKKIKIPVPKDQKFIGNIIKKIIRIENQIQLSILNYNKKIQNLEELKKSILDKAFKGEL